MKDISLDQFFCLDHLQEAICIISAERKIIYYNHYFSQLLHAPPRLLKKNPCLDEIITTETLNIHQLLNQINLQNPQSISEELSIQLPTDPAFSLTMLVKIIYLEKIPGHLVTFLNISDEKTLHDKYRQKTLELQQTHQQIVQADKIKSLVDISAGISHEISTPLAIARGNLEMVHAWLSQQAPVNVKVQEKKLDQLAKALKAIDTIKNIISNIRTFSMPHDDTREYYDLQTVIEECLELMGRKSTYQVQLQVAPHLRCVTIFNKIEIQQVVINILKNAIAAIEEFRPTGGLIRIDLGEDPDGQYFICSFTDNGPGIPLADRDKVFDIFYTTKKTTNGSGLGLTISKKIMEKHHGNIQISESAEGGAKVSLLFPKAAISSLSMDQGLLANFLDGDKRKILLIDDQVEVLNTVNQIISDMGHMAIGSTTAQDALHLLAKIDVDLVITDYTMPDINGTMLAQRIRENLPAIPIIYMSSSENFQYFLQDQEPLKLFSFLEKPFNAPTVQHAIEQALTINRKK